MTSLVYTSRKCDAAEPTRTYKNLLNCQQLDGSKVEGLCCEKRREQEKIGQQLWKQPWATTTPQMKRIQCGAQGHYRKDCPKIKNQNCGNKTSVPDARGRAYALGGGDVNPGSNTVTRAWLSKNHAGDCCDEKIVAVFLMEKEIPEALKSRDKGAKRIKQI
ncbi:hypothetical protein Tco_0232795 [Tanacetum coccineum]